MDLDQQLKAFFLDLADNGFWLADADSGGSLDERVTRVVLGFMRRGGAVEIAATDEQNLLAAVQMAGLGNLDQEALDSGPTQRVYELACDIAELVRARRAQVARRR